MTDTVRLERQGALAHIVLNRPSVLNALNMEMAQSLRDIAQELTAAPGLRAVLLRSEGRAFMAGGDIGLFSGEGATDRIGALIEVAHQALTLLTSLPVPVIAAVQGAAAGAGVGIACAADIIVAAEDAKFLLAYAQLGTSPDCGSTWILPRLLGLRRALGFALLEETLDAPTALQVGLVNRVVPAASLQAAALALAEKLAAGPTLAFGRTKALLRQSFDHDLPAQLAAERESFLACSRSADFSAGVTAFRDRKRPDFSGA